MEDARQPLLPPQADQQQAPSLQWRNSPGPGWTSPQWWEVGPPTVWKGAAPSFAPPAAGQPQGAASPPRLSVGRGSPPRVASPLRSEPVPSAQLTPQALREHAYSLSPRSRNSRPVSQRPAALAPVEAQPPPPPPPPPAPATEDGARGLDDESKVGLKERMHNRAQHVRHDLVHKLQEHHAHHDVDVGVPAQPAAVAAADSGSRAATLGPVVGLVTDSTARVMFEFSFSGEVEVRLVPANGSPVSCRKAATANRPCAFAFSGLTPDVGYRVMLEEGIECPVRGTVRTLSGNLRRPLTTAVVSCNKTQVVKSLAPQGKRDLWYDLGQRCENGMVDILFHIGDQIYADEVDEGIEGGAPESVFNSALLSLHQKGAKWVKNTGEILVRMKKEDRGDSINVIDGTVRPREEWESERSNILEAYRGLYRDAWGHLPTRTALANVSNVMLLDDHDISDDWGDRIFHRKQDSPEFFIGSLGLQVYREYQRALREDCDPVRRPFENEGFTLRWGRVGALCVDSRCPRSFRCPPEQLHGDPPLICSEQWQMMRSALDSFTEVEHLMMVTPVPLALFSQSMTRLGAQFVNDTAGQFAFSQLDLLLDLFDMLLRWRDAKPGRVVSLYSGDIHIGQHTDIFYNNKPAFKQIVASSVGNHGAGAEGRWVMRIMQRTPGHASVGRGWKFKHHTMLSAERNYGMSRVSREADGTILVQLTHVTSDDCVTEATRGQPPADRFVSPVNFVSRSDKYRSPYRCGCCSVQ